MNKYEADLLKAFTIQCTIATIANSAYNLHRIHSVLQIGPALNPCVIYQVT